jgi:putative transposase
MSTREERLDLLDWTNRELPISTQAELLGLNRTGLYYRPVPPSPEEVALKHRIDEIYTVYPFYGSRRITAQLRREGRQVSRKAVQRHMREMGLSAVYPGPNLSRREGKHGIHPYLLRGISTTRPNQVWGIDITYIRLLRGWMYLVAIMDWYSRYVVAWEMDQCLEVAFVIAALGRAFTQSRPEILNSDQGSQFTSEAYIELLHTAQVQISIDGRGRAIDNIFTERLWRSLKYEEVYLSEYMSPRDARHGIGRYLDFYNHDRVHQALGYRTPVEVYCLSQTEVAATRE